MKQSISFNQFHDAFRDHNRLDNFTYDGLKALFAYLEDLAEDCGTDFELDVIALCCEFSEYDTALEAAERQGYEEVVDLEPHGSVDLLEVAELQEAQALDYLQDHTSVITFDGGVIIQDF